MIKLQERIQELEAALSIYADEDNWSAPNGGGGDNIFRDDSPLLIDGYTIAQDILKKGLN